MLRKCYAKLRLPGKTVRGYKVHNLIGSGGFSAVFHCRERRTGKSYAMKVLQMAQYKRADSLDDVKNEVSLLRFLRETGGPFIGIVDDFEIDGFWYIIMQLADMGDIDRYSREWEQANGETLEEDNVADIMLDVFTGLAILHENGYAHRDIKPDNIFLQSPDSVDGTRGLIGDFGLAKEISYQNPDASFELPVGTNWFWAPETCRGRYGCAADIWAAGITTWLLLCGDHPLSGVTDNPTAAKDRAFCRGVATLEEKWIEGLREGASHLSEEAWDFLTMALNVRPGGRLSARRALEHPFLAVAREARDRRYSPENTPATSPGPQHNSTPTPLPPTPVPREQPSAPPVTREEADHPAGAPRRPSEMAAEVLRQIVEELRAEARGQAPVRRIRPDLIGPVKDNRTAIRKRARREVTPKVHHTRAAAAKKAETSVPPVVKTRKPRVKPAAAVPAQKAAQGKSARELRAEERARRKGL